MQQLSQPEPFSAQRITKRLQTLLLLLLLWLSNMQYQRQQLQLP
jgi:hypothetical protein